MKVQVRRVQRNVCRQAGFGTAVRAAVGIVAAIGTVLLLALALASRVMLTCVERLLDLIEGAKLTDAHTGCSGSTNGRKSRC
jgi:hypothetical protein